MEYQIKVEVILKPSLSDPEGEASAVSLRDLGYSVSKVSVSKVYHINILADSIKEARRFADEMCKRLLANPVKDDYKIEVERTF